MAISSCFQFLIFLVALGSVSASRSSSGVCNGHRANPSVFNFDIGGVNAKVISDGRLLFEVDEVYSDPPSVVKRALNLNFQSSSPIIFENNLLFLDKKDDKILFDTGNSYLRDTAGFLFKNLEAEGIRRESITKILINHGHFDHIGGLLLPDTKEVAFPNAEVYINRAEWEFWMAENVAIDPLDQPDENKAFLVETAKFIFNKIKDKVKLFQYGDDVIEGITAIDTRWHTPGHTSYLIEINGEKLLYSGDAFGIESTSINNPWFRLRFDLDKEAGVEGRVKLLDDLAQSKMLVVDYHTSFPGLGRIVANDLTFDWKPFNWEFSEGVKTRCT